MSALAQLSPLSQYARLRQSTVRGGPGAPYVPQIKTSERTSVAGEAPMHRTRLPATLLAAALIAMGLLVAASRPVAAAATVLYVDQSNASCSDSGAGTQTAPFCTIGQGAAVATAGQTVQVASGTYNELVTVAHSGTSGAPIVLTAAPGASV